MVQNLWILVWTEFIQWVVHLLYQSKFWTQIWRKFSHTLLMHIQQSIGWSDIIWANPCLTTVMFAACKYVTNQSAPIELY